MFSPPPPARIKPQGFKPAPERMSIENFTPPETWLDAFKELEDPRREKRTWHPLLSIIGLSLLAVLCGAEHWEQIEVYARSKQRWLESFLDLPFGIPSHDTIERVFEHLDGDAFEASFQQWVQLLLESGGDAAKLIALDGKTQRGSYDRTNGLKALHQVSAWASDHRLVLAQLPVDKKSNEITAIPLLLEMLAVEGCIITIDAMGTQKSIAKQIRAKKADYILTLKANHSNFYKRVSGWVEEAQAKDWEGIEFDFAQSQETGHGRDETRQIWAIPITELPDWSQLADWEGLQSLVIVARERILWNKTTFEVQFYLTSCAPKASHLAQVIRSHWGIENQLHWVLDVSFAEDASRMRKGNRPRNFSLLRRLALNLLSRELTYKKSLNLKRYRASMDNDYLCDILANGA
jgi:predicted transposase YbfD/YdcC